MKDLRYAVSYGPLDKLCYRAVAIVTSPDAKSIQLIYISVAGLTEQWNLSAEVIECSVEWEETDKKVVLK